MKRIRDKELIASIIEDLKKMHPEAACALDHRSLFELVVAVVLSAQTTDVSVNKVTPVLFERYPDPEALAAADRSEVEDIIRTIGLYKNKAANIIKLAQKLNEDYGGEVPGNFDDLVSLPGVGRKTANVVLAEGFKVPRIAVDTHVFRVSNRIGLAEADDVNETEKQLMESIPEHLWILAHHLLIFHGRKCCKARKPECNNCLLNDKCCFYGRKMVQ
ncbi:MAG: endonuclease III [Clostridiales bacterium]|nr:endonuclease III [Clostridiales bacterium]